MRDFKVYQASGMLNFFNKEATDVRRSTKTESGNPIVISDASGDDLLSCIVALDLFQSGTGDPTPTNIRPITAYSNTKVFVSDADTSNPVVYQAQFPAGANTIYEGTVDFINGILTVERMGIILDGSETWTGISGAFYTQALPAGYSFASQDDWVCNKYTPATRIPRSTAIPNRPDMSTFNQENYERRVFIKDSTILSEADLQTALASSPMVLVYSLSTPAVYNITPVIIPLNVGDNNIWTDGTTVTVEYT